MRIESEELDFYGIREAESRKARLGTETLGYPVILFLIPESRMKK